MHFLSIPCTEDDIILDRRPNLGLVLRYFNVASVEVWQANICSWVSQSVATSIHVDGDEDKLLLIRLPNVGYCQDFAKYLERVESDRVESDAIETSMEADGRWTWEEKGKAVDRGNHD